MESKIAYKQVEVRDFSFKHTTEMRINELKTQHENGTVVLFISLATVIYYISIHQRLEYLDERIFFTFYEHPVN